MLMTSSDLVQVLSLVTMNILNFLFLALEPSGSQYPFPKSRLSPATKYVLKVNNIKHTHIKM